MMKTFCSLTGCCQRLNTTLIGRVWTRYSGRESLKTQKNRCSSWQERYFGKTMPKGWSSCESLWNLENPERLAAYSPIKEPHQNNGKDHDR